MILTIDIGGSAIKSALYHPNGTRHQSLPSQKSAVSAHDNQLLKQITAHILNIQTQHPIQGIAIASAGIVNPKTGHIVYAGPTIPNYSNTPLAQHIQDHCQLPCSVENDVNAAALGEHWLGAAQGSDSVLCLTIGTGVGGALILNNQLWRGHQFSAGEIGYLPLSASHTLQQKASTTALLQHYHTLGNDPIDGKTFFARYQQNDPHAHSVFTNFIDHLTTGLLPLIYLINPHTLLIGGGISAQSSLLEPALTQSLSQRIQDPRFLPKRLTCAQLGNSAGMLGALRHFLNQYPQFIQS